MWHDQAHQRRLRRWWALPVMAGVLLLGVAAWGVAAHQPRLPETGPAPVLTPSTKAARLAAAAPAPGRHLAAAKALAAVPGSPATAFLPPMPKVLPVGAESVQIPSLHVEAAATPESVKAGTLGVPDSPAVVGWWMPSTAELVIDGHVDMEGSGPGALYGVRDLRPGAAIIVRTSSGAEHWRVDGVRTYQKGHVPAGLFHGNETESRLVIVTCGGPFDNVTHHYADNVIAYASSRR